MNSFIETLNQWGGTFLDFAWPIAWQSGLLVAVLLAFDFLFRRQVRASVRYAVWLVVLVKLILPPTLALPTSPAWWLLRQPPVIQIKPQMQNYTVSYDDESLPPASLNPLPAYVPPQLAMTSAAWLLILSAVTSAGLLAWLLIRWWQITRRVSRAKTSERLTAIAAQTRLLAGVRARPPVKLTADTMSPAVCGLFRPAILIPQTLAENFSDEQLRAVLLHELIHLRRRDVWLNFLQSLLQIVYWWHPLVWLANARIRRVREEAVDDAVMLALAGGAEAYAPTLLQVARLALNRPLVSLGLVGIMESRSALRQRIERLVDFRPPRRAGLTLVSIFGILAFTAVAVPMGGAPGATEEQVLPAPAIPVPAVAARDTNPPAILIEVQIYQLRAVDFEKAVSSLKFNQAWQDNNSWWSASPENFNQLSETFRASGLKPVNRLRTLARSGRPAGFFVGNDTNSLGFDCLPFVTNGWIELTSQGKALATSASISTTNQFSVKALVEDHGGMVIRMNNADGSIESNVFMVTIGVQMVANTPPSRYQQRLETIIKKKQPSADDMVKSASLVTDARVDYESGELDEAEQLVKFALALNPDNAAAKYYLGLINDARQRRQDGAQSVPGRAKLIEILNRTRFDEFVTKKRMPLEDVLSQLSRKAQQADPDVHGINIITASITPDQAGDANSITIGSMNLKHVTLGEVLDVITMIADEPIKYSVMDNGIVFSEKNRLFTRLYPIDKAVLFEEQQKQTGLPIKKKVADISLAFRKYFSKSGVNMNLPPGKSVDYDDRLGQLIVRTTESDLDIIDRAIQALRQTTPSGQSGLQFSGPQEFPPSLGMTDVQGILSNPNFLVALHELQKRTGVESLPEPEVVTRTGRYANWLGGVSIPLASEISAESSSQTNLAKPQIHVKARFLEVPKGVLLGLINDFDVTRDVIRTPAEVAHQPSQYAGILTSKNFKTALQSIEQQKGVVELAEPEATTTIGRQLSMRATKTVDVIDSFNFKETNGVNEFVPNQSKVEVGPALHMFSTTFYDYGYTIGLQAGASRAEFFGYADVPTNTPPQYATNSTGQTIPLPIFWPAIQLNQESVNANLFDGQTLVLTPEVVQVGTPDEKRDKIVAQHIHEGEKIQGEADRQLVVFVTVELVDIYGKRLHSDDDLSFAEKDIPPQPPQPGPSDSNVIIP